MNHLSPIKRNKTNSIYLESESDYVNQLCNRYHVKKIKLKINENEENKLIDGNLILIKKIRKSC